MEFRRTNHFAVDVRSEDYDKAVDFYVSTFNLKINERGETRTYLEGPNFGLFIVKSDTPGVDQEFTTNDLEKAKEHFEKSGCKIVKWQGPGKSNRVEDPYGLIFNVWYDEKK